MALVVLALLVLGFVVLAVDFDLAADFVAVLGTDLATVLAGCFAFAVDLGAALEAVLPVDFVVGFEVLVVDLRVDFGALVLLADALDFAVLVALPVDLDLGEDLAADLPLLGLLLEVLAAGLVAGLAAGLASDVLDFAVLVVLPVDLVADFALRFGADLARGFLGLAAALALVSMADLVAGAAISGSGSAIGSGWVDISAFAVAMACALLALLSFSTISDLGGSSFASAALL